MSRKNHSIGLKLFIFLLVAMMLFSAIGVMVIYLNVPTVTPTTAILPSEPTTITLPPSETTTGNDIAPASGEAMIDAEVLVDEAPTEPTPNEEIDAEPTPAPAQ